MERFLPLIQLLYPGAELKTCEALTGGVSAIVHRLDLMLANQEIHKIVVREQGATHSGHPAATEFALLKALAGTGLPVPEPLYFDEHKRLLPHDFLVLTYIEGSTEIPQPMARTSIELAANCLRTIHQTPTQNLPNLPTRNHPLPEAFDYWPLGEEWLALKTYLKTLDQAQFIEAPVLLHGDFWPENLIWRDHGLVGILDWEDAALGDPLSDLAVARLEFRYRYGSPGAANFTTIYVNNNPIEWRRLALWQIYVAAAAQHFMADWGLSQNRESHMRAEALKSIQEAGNALMRNEPSFLGLSSKWRLV